MQWHRDEFTIDTDRKRLDLPSLTAWIQGSYWASDRSTEAVHRSWAAAIPFGLYAGDRQIGCARVVSDCVSIAYLADVFILPEFRGRGLGAWLMESILLYPDLATVRWLLHTRDAHDLYRKFGFDAPGERVMERPSPSAR